MDKERIVRLINFDEEDVSTGYINVGGSVIDVTKYTDILENIEESIITRDWSSWIEYSEEFTEIFCNEFGTPGDDEGDNLLVYDFIPAPKMQFTETASWNETIKGLWCDQRKITKVQHENTGIMLSYHNSSEPYYKLFYSVFDYVNRRYDYAWDNAKTIYDYFKSLIEHIRRNE